MIYIFCLDTLIVFSDEERNNEFALSFLVPEGREYIWKQIKMFQLENYSDIPKPTLKDLSKLNGFIKRYSAPSSRAVLNQHILRDEFFDQLINLPNDILKSTEILPSLTFSQKQSFSALFAVIGDLFLINDVNITRFLLSMEKDRVKKVIDCLQYDETIDRCMQHNFFIENDVKHNKV
jgi:hypothetical protein